MRIRAVRLAPEPSVVRTDAQQLPRDAARFDVVTPGSFRLFGLFRGHGDSSAPRTPYPAARDSQAARGPASPTPAGAAACTSSRELIAAEQGRNARSVTSPEV